MLRYLAKGSTARRGGRGRGFRGGSGPESWGPVFVGLGIFVVICVGLIIWFGRKRLSEYCRSRHQTGPTKDHVINNNNDNNDHAVTSNLERTSTAA